MVALKTFENLDEKRKQQIIQVALKEFAVNGYEQASLSEIIKKLKLAKGSFYRYFDSKQSLYFYLLEYCSKTRLAHDDKHIKQKSDDFFEMMLQHFSGKIHFDKIHPNESAFLHSVYEEKNNDEIIDLQFRGKEKVLDLIRKEVKHQLKKNKLRKDIDVSTLAYITLQFNISILDFLAYQHKIDYRKNIKEGKPLYGLSEKTMVKAARNYMDIFKNGILKK